MTKTFSVATLDVWGNAEAGYAVNDTRVAGRIEVSNEAPEAEIWCALIEAGIAKGLISYARFEWEDESVLHIEDAEDGRPVFSLFLVEEERDENGFLVGKPEGICGGHNCDGCPECPKGAL